MSIDGFPLASSSAGVDSEVKAAAASDTDTKMYLFKFLNQQEKT
jgi:hypothetical protein